MDDPTGHISNEILSALADGEADFSGRKWAHDHVGTCSQCRTMLGELTNVRHLIGGLPALVAPEAVISSALSIRSRSLHRGARWSLAVAATAAIVISLGGLASPADQHAPPVDAFVTRHVGVNAGSQAGAEVLFAVHQK